MKVVVKTKFNTSKQQIERYGPDKYLVYLPYPQDDSAKGVIAAMLSKSMGVPPHRISFIAVDSFKNWLFEAS